MLEVCYDERRNYWQDDHEPNGLNGDTLWLVGASICDGRCSGLFQMDISVGVSCSEIRLNGNVVLSDMCPATVVYELAIVQSCGYELVVVQSYGYELVIVLAVHEVVDGVERRLSLDLFTS